MLRSGQSCSVQQGVDEAIDNERIIELFLERSEWVRTELQRHLHEHVLIILLVDIQMSKYSEKVCYFMVDGGLRAICLPLLKL